MNITQINKQAIIAGVFFLAAVGISRMVVNIHSGKWKPAPVMVLYLRALLGFLLAGAIALAFYAFAGIDVITGRF